jgi:hypothetical protein
MVSENRHLTVSGKDKFWASYSQRDYIDYALVISPDHSRFEDVIWDRELKAGDYILVARDTLEIGLGNIIECSSISANSRLRFGDSYFVIVEFIPLSYSYVCRYEEPINS